MRRSSPQLAVGQVEAFLSSMAAEMVNCSSREGTMDVVPFRILEYEASYEPRDRRADAARRLADFDEAVVKERA